MKISLLRPCSRQEVVQVIGPIFSDMKQVEMERFWDLGALCVEIYCKALNDGLAFNIILEIQAFITWQLVIAASMWHKSCLAREHFILA